MRADVLGDLSVRCQRRGQHDPDVVLLHDVAGAVPDARLQPRERDRREAPQRPEVRGSLARVADPELDVVDAVEREEVLRLGERVLVEMGARLVGGRRASDPRVGGVGRGVGHGVLRLRRLPGGGTVRGPDGRLVPLWPRAWRVVKRRSVVPDSGHDRVPSRGVACRVRVPSPSHHRGRPLAARRTLRHRARGLMGSARGPRPRGRDAPVLAGRVRANRRGGTRTRRWAPVRAHGRRPAAPGRPRARPEPAPARALRSDRQLDRALGTPHVRRRSPATSRPSASTYVWAR